MKIVIVEPFYGGSHKQWTDSLSELYKSAGHQVEVIALPARHWKWRMFGAANYLAEKFINLSVEPDVLITSDMIDLPTFVGIARKYLSKTKLVVYFHENQLTYPWSPTDEDVKLKRDQSYGLINLRTALIADEVYFNSAYHKHSFISALENFIKQFPDAINKGWGREVEAKSAVLSLGMDLEVLSKFEKQQEPVLLWNHRWEYDKNPDDFYDVLLQLKNDKLCFKLIVCGEKSSKYPKVFDLIKRDFAEELIHFGYAESKEAYHKLLMQATVLPVTCNQDFFGGSVVEAIAAGCVPVLPNRLAYPEHVPAGLAKKYVLEGNQEWLFALKDAVINLKLHQDNIPELRAHVLQYDWSNLKEDYLGILYPSE